MPNRDSDFESDAASLFSGTRSGHMEKWEYGNGLFEGDKAAGAAFWAALVRSPGNYYLSRADIDNINWATGRELFRSRLQGVESIVELGPGCQTSLDKKTVPLIEATPDIQHYHLVDHSQNIALEAASYIRSKTGLETGATRANFFHEPLEKPFRCKTAVIFFGSSLGNIEGVAGQEPSASLVALYQNISKSLGSGDLFLFSFDTERNAEKVTAAYREPMLQRQILSILFRMKRDGVAMGQFDPDMWIHQPEWIESSSQCAHFIYPSVDQHFCIGGQEFTIPANKKFLSNNSYKYCPEKMRSAVIAGGFREADVFQSGPMALLLAVR